jgi:hypothetical protein
MDIEIDNIYLDFLHKELKGRYIIFVRGKIIKRIPIDENEIRKKYF